MRAQQLKLTKGHSTKGERRFMEVCKRLHIPFRAKVKVKGREVDFVIGSYAVEIDSHKQDVEKNLLLVSDNLLPVHFANYSPFEEWLKRIKE